MLATMMYFPRDINSQINSLTDEHFKYPVLSPDIRTIEGEPQNPHVVETISNVRNLIYDLYHSYYWLASMITWLLSISRCFTNRTDGS